MTIVEPGQATVSPRFPGRALRARATGIVRWASGAIPVSRAWANALIRRLPGTIEATRTGAHRTTNAIQVLPDTTLRSLAATSVGLGAGFYLAGTPRLVVAAGVAPAIVMGAAIALRPLVPSIESETKAPPRIGETVGGVQ